VVGMHWKVTIGYNPNLGLRDRGVSLAEERKEHGDLARRRRSDPQARPRARGADRGSLVSAVCSAGMPASRELIH
jgi:hypothetical protein